MRSSSGWELGLEIAAGAAVLIGAAVVIYCVCRSARRKACREGAPLIEDDERNTAYGGNGVAVNSGEWMFGELDYAGLKRVLDWLAKVREAFAKNGGIEPIADEVVVDSARLGQIDDIGSPPQGYSPRVSAIGSDDGTTRGSKDHFASRDPLRR